MDLQFSSALNRVFIDVKLLVHGYDCHKYNKLFFDGGLKAGLLAAMHIVLKTKKTKTKRSPLHNMDSYMLSLSLLVA